MHPFSYRIRRWQPQRCFTLKTNAFWSCISVLINIMISQNVSIFRKQQIHSDFFPPNAACQIIKTYFGSFDKNIWDKKLMGSCGNGWRTSAVNLYRLSWLWSTQYTVSILLFTRTGHYRQILEIISCSLLLFWYDTALALFLEN